MPRQYSIAEARRHLADLVDQAASGSDVRLMRHGRPVAVVVSVERYQSLRRQKSSFARAYRQFRREFPEGRGGIAPGFFRSLRDRGEGRKVDL